MVVGWLLSWLVFSLSIGLVAAILPGFEVKGVKGAILVALIYGLLNALIGPLLFVVFGIASLGIGFLLAFITRWIINALLLKLTDALTDLLTIRSFGMALIAALLISLLGTLLEGLLGLAA